MCIVSVHAISEHCERKYMDEVVSAARGGSPGMDVTHRFAA